MIVTPVKKINQSIAAGVGLLVIGLMFSATATSASSTDPVVVTQKAVINVNGAILATVDRDGQGEINVFPIPQKSISYACKRVDIAVIPYGTGGYQNDGGEVWTKGGCKNSSPLTISSTFKMVAYARKRAEDLCKRTNPTRTIDTKMNVPFLVKRRYCFLDMEGDDIPGGTHWSVDCGEDGTWVNKTIYFPVEVSCEKSVPPAAVQSVTTPQPMTITQSMATTQQGVTIVAPRSSLITKTNRVDNNATLGVNLKPVYDAQTVGKKQQQPGATRAKPVVSANALPTPVVFGSKARAFPKATASALQMGAAPKVQPKGDLSRPIFGPSPSGMPQLKMQSSQSTLGRASTIQPAPMAVPRQLTPAGKTTAKPHAKLPAPTISYPGNKQSFSAPASFTVRAKLVSGNKVLYGIRQKGKPSNVARDSNGRFSNLKAGNYCIYVTYEPNGPSSKCVQFSVRQAIKRAPAKASVTKPPAPAKASAAKPPAPARQAIPTSPSRVPVLRK